MVWSGVEWCGVVLCGVVLCGVMWCTKMCSAIFSTGLDNWIRCGCTFNISYIHDILSAATMSVSDNLPSNSLAMPP